MANVGWGNGLSPDGINPLPEQILKGNFQKKSFFDKSLEIANLRLQPLLPGASELMSCDWQLVWPAHDTGSRCCAPIPLYTPDILFTK